MSGLLRPRKFVVKCGTSRNPGDVFQWGVGEKCTEISKNAKWENTLLGCNIRYSKHTSMKASTVFFLNEP